MSYPLIILGAGASYDYTDLHSKIRPPLTKHLLNPDVLNTSISDKYEAVNSLFSEMRPLISKQNKSFEECLKFIQESVGNNLDRKIQLISLRFYLQEFFKNISDECKSINHYKALINKILGDKESRACVVSFNYDTLFEQSFKNKEWNNINSYINDPIKLIKLHGSHDWVYIIDATDEMKFLEINNSYDYLKRYPDHMNQLLKQGILPYHIKQIVRDKYFKFPALAIPLPEKQDYICPPKHIDILKNCLKEIDRILIIGWKAGDQKFCDMLKENMNTNREIPITIVAGNDGSAKIIKEKIQYKISFNCQIFNGGFSEFVGSEDFNNFFRD